RLAVPCYVLLLHGANECTRVVMVVGHRHDLHPPRLSNPSDVLTAPRPTNKTSRRAHALTTLAAQAHHPHGAARIAWGSTGCRGQHGARSRHWATRSHAAHPRSTDHCVLHGTDLPDGGADSSQDRKP